MIFLIISTPIQTRLLIYLSRMGISVFGSSSPPAASYQLTQALEYRARMVTAAPLPSRHFCALPVSPYTRLRIWCISETVHEFVLSLDLQV